MTRQESTRQRVPLRPIPALQCTETRGWWWCSDGDGDGDGDGDDDDDGGGDAVQWNIHQ